MITAQFVLFKSTELPYGFTISGHAGWADRGKDVVCAAVSSAVELTCNTVTDFFGVDAEVVVLPDEARIELFLPSYIKAEHPSVKLLASLRAHLDLISEDHPGTVEVTAVPHN